MWNAVFLMINEAAALRIQRYTENSLFPLLFFLVMGFPNSPSPGSNYIVCLLIIMSIVYQLVSKLTCMLNRIIHIFSPFGQILSWIHTLVIERACWQHSHVVIVDLNFQRYSIKILYARIGWLFLGILKYCVVRFALSYPTLQGVIWTVKLFYIHPYLVVDDV